MLQLLLIRVGVESMKNEVEKTLHLLNLNVHAEEEKRISFVRTTRTEHSRMEQNTTQQKTGS